MYSMYSMFSTYRGGYDLREVDLCATPIVREGKWLGAGILKVIQQYKRGPVGLPHPSQVQKVKAGSATLS